MKPEWILIANASRARLYSRESEDDRLVLLEAFEHPQSRLKGHDLQDARPGHDDTDHRIGGTSLTPRTDARRKEHRHFADELARRLEQGLQQDAFRALTVWASSPFLGELKQALPERLRHRVTAMHDVDLSGLAQPELQARLRQAASHS